MDLLKPLKGARDEFRQVCKENNEINAMPAITQEQQAAKHAAVIAARERRTGGSDWRNRGVGNVVVHGSKMYAVRVFDRRLNIFNRYLAGVGSWAKCIERAHEIIEDEYPDTGMEGIVIQGDETGDDVDGFVSYNHPDSLFGDRMWISITEQKIDD